MLTCSGVSRAETISRSGGTPASRDSANTSRQSSTRVEFGATSFAKSGRMKRGRLDARALGRRGVEALGPQVQFVEPALGRIQRLGRPDRGAHAALDRAAVLL